MARSAKKKIDAFVDQKIIPMNIEKIVGDRFGKYSKYIIQERALPDVRDGLKPVQRRILFAMNELGLKSNKPYKKSARIVGDVIGKYHPHGDSSVYDALVRMSQKWKMGTLLIDMHGNNGSIDNDPAAAMRYTEARLTVYAEALLEDIDKKTVNFIPNFDDEELEPVVLPAKFPNLLVNGSQGMATGYATNIPPHNLSEVLKAVIYKTKHPTADVEELMEFIKGPDFPTGAIVEGINGIKKAFKTGKGKIVIKSKAEVKDTSIIITEIPFEVNKADLVRKIDEIRINKKIDGIVEVKDMSDRDGLQIVISLKKEIASDVILAYLYKNTDLSVSYNYNMVAIYKRSPKQLSIVEIIEEYIQHQKEIIRNRSNYELRKTETRKHIVLGFLKMVDVLDEVIDIIRKSSGKKDSIEKLMKRFSFSEVQADAIVSLQLYRLSTTDVSEMRNESAQLSKIISKLHKILTNEQELEDVIITELEALLEKYPTERKTEISGHIKKVEIDEQELIQNENVMFVCSKDGYIKRSSLKSYQATVGETGLKENDFILKKSELNTRDNLLFFTSYGNFITLPVYKTPDYKWRDIGEYIGNFAHLEPGESIIDYLVIDEFDEERDILVANQEGQIKHVLLSEFQKQRINKTYNVLPASKINKLVTVDLREKYDAFIVLATKNGYVLKYDAEEVPIQSLAAKGVKGINLRDDVLVGAKFTTNINKDEVLFLTNRGGLKREFSQNIDTSHRPAKGKRYLKTVKSNPFEFIQIASENVFRLKEYIAIRIIAKKKELIIPGIELKPDRYENGIQYLKKSDKPEILMIDKDRYYEANEILFKLMDSDVEDEEETIEEPESDELMLGLEKIISGNDDEEEPDDLDSEEPDDEYEDEDKDEDEDDDEDDFEEDDEEKDSEEDDLDDNMIQQTLF